jgi:glycine/D-amino acid oxidase-like deaminating enzyme
MIDTADVVVIGGGCTGTSIAWQLASQGAGRVVLIEKQQIAAGATGRSSAIVRTHYTHPALARMALRALRVFERFGEIVGGNAEFRPAGFLALVPTIDAGALAANVAMHRELGIAAQLVQPSELAEIEPRMARDDIGAAAWEPESGYADPHGTAASYAAAARRRGAELRIGPRAESIGLGPAGVEWVATDAGRIATRTAVVAAGYRSRELLAVIGVDLPLTPVRHDLAIVRRTPEFGASHPVISDRVLGSYYRPEGGELTLIGTTAAHEGHQDSDVERDRAPFLEDTATLVDRFSRRFPGQAQAALRGGYTGVYDCSPDLQPILGPVPGIPGLHVAAGFSGHGFKLSPVVGELIAEQILTGRTTLIDLELFSLARFAEGRTITSQHAYSVPTLG